MDATLLALGREALLLSLLLSTPPLLAAMAVGLAVGVLQAATQVQEPALGALPRVGAALGALLLAAPWISARLLRFAASVLELSQRGLP